MTLIIRTFFIIIFFCFSLQAQEKPAPFIPYSKSNTDAITEINRMNSYVYRDLLPAEIFDLVTSGKIIVRADIKSDFSWNNLGANNIGVAINSSQAPTDNVVGKLIPYGQFSELTLKGDKKKAFSEILTNITSHFWRMPYWKLNFQLLWFENDKLKRGAKGVYQRMFPKLLDENHKSLQLYRESFIINEPKKISNIGWLSYRFLSDDEDLYWLLSPFNNQSVSLTGANRSDRFPSTFFSPDDLFSWSVKNEFIEGTIKGERNFLVPISQTMPINAQNSEGCIIKEADKSKSEFSPGTNRWNFDSKQFNAAGWSPGDQRFVVRPLTELQIFSNDFFTDSGRQTLFVDAENFLPYYKIVYDRSGAISKIIITSFTAYNSSVSANPFFIPTYTLVIDRSSNGASILEFGEYQGCQALPAGVTPADFDPKSYGVVNEKVDNDKNGKVSAKKISKDGPNDGIAKSVNTSPELNNNPLNQ